MKKFIFLIGFLLLLGGCASEARVAALERQVLELEKKQASEKQKGDFSWKGDRGFMWEGKSNFSWQ